uniref:Uncharacterized protein n=1 Tax=viral metagenome TaxID=1070528 RepID=A0A6C0DDW0_9ZZZZ
MWKRLASMYTNLNLIFVLLIRWLPESVQDIVRASTFLILVVVSTVWFSGDLVRTYGELVDSFIRGQSFALPRVVRIGIAAAGDILLHVVPVFAIGLPQMGRSFLIAFGLLSTWYATARRHIHAIYAPSIQGKKADRGIMIAGIVSLGSYLIYNKSTKESEQAAEPHRASPLKSPPPSE